MIANKEKEEARKREKALQRERLKEEAAEEGRVRLLPPYSIAVLIWCVARGVKTRITW